MKDVLLQHRKFAGVFLFLVLLAVVSMLYSWRHCQQSIDRYREAKNDFQQLTVSLYESSNEKEFLAENLGVFRSLIESDALGEVDPMVWVEVFEDLRVSLELDDFFYEISPVTLMEASDDSSLEIQWMTISFQSIFKHDEALFQFISELRNNISFPYQVKQLEIVRKDGGEGENTTSSLQVIGEIAWVLIVPLAAEPLEV